MLQLANQPFGTLVAIEPDPVRAKNGAVRWHCRCSHGALWTARASDLHRKRVIGCGCEPGSRTRARRVTVGDETKTLREWQDANGVQVGTIRQRLEREWPAKRAVEPRVRVLKV